MSKRNPFKDALNGIVVTYRGERNLRIHVVLALAAVALGVLLDVSHGEWCWIALCISLVVMAELINTAIEAMVDLASPNKHPLAKKAKDAAAAAVLIAAVFALSVGGMIFLPRLWAIIIG